MKSTEYRAILGGARGVKPALWRGLFRCVSIPYALGVWGNDWLWRSGLRKVRRLERPTVSVGNLTLGGTGKTPMIAFLTRFFLEQGLFPAILSRGYGAPTHHEQNSVSDYGVQNDEALELAEMFPEIPHFLSPNRWAAGKALLLKHPERNILLLDDGLQYRRLARDLEIVLLDATEPFGFERLFPAGTLREPLSALRRADLVLLSRADQATPKKRAEIRQRVERIAPKAVWGEITQRPTGLVQFQAGKFLRTPLPQKIPPVAAFCGIGNPGSFLTMLTACGYEVENAKIFPDHHHYCDSDIAQLTKIAQSSKAEAIFCTMKDLVKIRRSDFCGIPLFAVEIGVEFLVGEEGVMGKLRGLLPPRC